MSHPFIPLYVDDYDAATSHLTAEEDGVYGRLLRLCWRTPGCSIPTDPEWIARKVRVTAADYERVVTPVLKEFFKVSRGRYVQRRLKAEYENISRKKVSRQNAGKNGGLAKAAKTKDKESSKATILLGDTRAFPEPEPYRDKIPETNVSGAADFSTSGLDKSAWELAEKILLTQGGLNPRSAKSFFGRLLSENRIAARELINPLADCQSSGTKDPQGYLRRCAQNRGRRPPDANAAPLKRVTFV